MLNGMVTSVYVLSNTYLLLGPCEQIHWMYWLHLLTRHLLMPGLSGFHALG